MENDWKTRWENSYLDFGESIPWETFKVDENLKNYVEKNKKNIKTAIDIGCGLGTNSLWMAEQGIKVTSIDISDKAIDFCNKNHINDNVNFYVLDFLNESSFLFDNEYDFIFDRGCFHSINSPDIFLKNIKKILSKKGVWFSLIGSDSGPYVMGGPPRKKASEISFYVENYLNIKVLQSCKITLFNEVKCPAWNLICEQKSSNFYT